MVTGDEVMAKESIGALDAFVVVGALAGKSVFPTIDLGGLQSELSIVPSKDSQPRGLGK